MLRKAVYIGAIMLSVSQFFGCAYMISAKPNDFNRIDELIAEQKYSVAEQRLIKMRADNPLYPQRAKKLAQLKTAVWNFERSIIRRAVVHEHKQHWVEAGRVFDEGLGKLPDSKIIVAAHEQFLDRREARKQDLKAELLVNEGERLLRDGRAHKQILQMAPKNLKAKFDYALYENKKSKVANDLFEYGESASQRRDFHLAKRFLSVANKLDSNLKTQQALLAVNAQINRNRPTVASSATKRKVYKQLVLKYKKSLSAGELVSAQRQMVHLKKHYSSQAELNALAAELDAIVSAKVTVASELGREFYSQGKVQKALNIWKKALPLDPKNEDLKSKILRAEKVLENIRILNKKQSG